MRAYDLVLLISASLPAALSFPPCAYAQTTGLEDLVGARAGQAEGELGRRGYVNTGGSTGDDRSYSNWWSSERRQCVTISTMDGRYGAITPTTAPDCGKSASTARRQRRSEADAQREGSVPQTAGDLPRYCKGEAAAAFDKRPSEITTNMPIKLRNSSIVTGWYEGEKRTKFFSCSFDADGRFLSVR